jgi:hypothetical protein
MDLELREAFEFEQDEICHTAKEWQIAEAAIDFSKMRNEAGRTCGPAFGIGWRDSNAYTLPATQSEMRGHLVANARDGGVLDGWATGGRT